MNLRSLAEIISETCSIPAAQLTAQTRLVEAGMTSLDAIALRRSIDRSTGIRLPFIDFGPRRSLGELVDRIDEELRQRPDAAGWAHSTAAESDPHSRTSPPALAAQQSDEASNAPLTDVQAAYWVGRDPDLPLGGVATYWFHEYESTQPDPDRFLDRLEDAWRRLVEHHPMLRMRVTPAGRQRIEPTSDWALERIDLRTDPAPHDTVAHLRAEADHRNLVGTGGPPFWIRAVLLPGSVRVQVGFDAIAVDLRSWRLVMHQWGLLVAEPGTDLPAPRFDFCRRVADGPAAEHGRCGLPSRPRTDEDHRPPPLPITQIPRDGHRFAGHEGVLPGPVWQRVRGQAAAHGLTPTGVALMAFSAALALQAGAGSLALTVDGRGEYESDASVVGDFARLVALAPPVRRWSNGETPADLAVRVSEALAEAVDTGESAVELGRQAHVRDGEADGMPVLPVVFTSALGDDGSTDDVWLGERVHRVSQTPQVLIDHIVRQERGDLLLCIDSVDEALEPGFAEALCRTAVGLLGALADPAAWRDPAWGADPTGELPRPRVPSPFGGIGDRIDDPLRSAETSPAPAILTREGELSHRALARGAAAIAGELEQRGVGAGRPVVVAVPKSAAQIAAVLGVMRAGAWYVPVDPDWPGPRLDAVRRKSGATTAIAFDSARDGSIGELFDVLVVDEEGRPVPSPAQENGSVATATVDDGAALRHSPAPDRAYAIFTSGSTGEPKGVAITHSQARTTIDAVVDRFRICDDDRVLGVSALTFDLSVFDVFGMLGIGGGLVLPDESQLRDPSAWCELIEQHEVTVWNSAPPLLEMLVEFAEHEPGAASRLRSLRTVMLSGDWIPVTLPDRLRALVPDARVHSLGGATEASIWSITHPVREEDRDATSIPYGRALPGQSLFVLDEDGVPAVVGGLGELVIGGEGVAECYLDDPQQTAERFVELSALGRRVYRTGDQGRWLRSGEIEFCGRVDRQVKITGFRIELGEVEAALTRVPGVRAAVAAGREGPDGRLRLVAWVGGTGLETAAVRAAAAERLPDYMLPSILTVLPALPVTDNGKIDHRALPDPFDVRTVAAEPEAEIGRSAAPSSEVVRDLVAELLPGEPDPGRSLLEQGGTSLDAVRVANAVEERWGHRPSVRALLSDRSLAGVLREVRDDGPGEAPDSADGSRAGAEEVDGAAGRDRQSADGLGGVLRLPPLPAELRIARPPVPDGDQLRELAAWLDSLGPHGGTARWGEGPDDLLVVPLDPTTEFVAAPAHVGTDIETCELTEMQTAYLLGRRDDAVGVRFAPHYYTEVRVTDFDPQLFRRSLDEVAAAHPMLRARITHDARQHVLPVDAPDARIPLRVHDRASESARAAEEAVAEVRAARSHEVIDPVTQPSLSFDAIAFPDGSWVLCLSLDLLFVDAASAVHLVEALERALEGLPVERPGADFRQWAEDVAAVRRGAGGVQRSKHWRTRLTALPQPAITGPQPGAIGAGDQPRAVRHEIRIGADSWRAVVQTGRARGLSPTVLVLTAAAGAVAPADGSTGTTLILTLFDRPEQQRGVIGDFTSTLVIGLPATAGSFLERACAVRDRLAEDLEHSVGPAGVHGNEVLRAWAQSGGPERVPIVFSSGLGSVSTAAGGPVDAGRLLDRWGTTEFAISQTPGVLADIQVFEDAAGLTVRIDAVDALLSPGWADTVLAETGRALRALTESSGWDDPDALQGPRNAVPPEARRHDEALVRTAVEETRPHSGLRSRLRDLLGETIGRDPAELDPDARFFALGVDSLGLIRFQRRLAEEGLQVDVLDLFEASTLRALARRLDVDRVSDPEPAESDTPPESRAPDVGAPRSRRDRRRAARRAATRI